MEQPKTDTPPEQTPPVAPVSSTTAEGYVVPKGEEGMFHVELEQRSARFNQETGEKNHKPFVQKYHPRDFALSISTNDRGEPVYATVGWRMNKILHIPSEKALEGILVNTVVDRKVVKVPIATAIETIRGIIVKQDEKERK